MGQPEINQMKQALIRQGIQPFTLNGLNEDTLRQICNEKLAQSLTGKQNWGNSDGFIKRYKYDEIYTLPNGEKIKVAKIATSVLSSGRKVETFIDIAGNQYFQYRSADGKILKENYFKKQEKMILGSGFKFVDNKLYKTDFLGNLLLVEDDKTKEQKPFSVHNIIEQNKIKYHPVYKDLVLNKQGNIDMKQFDIDSIKKKYNDQNYKIKQITNPEELHYGVDKTLVITSAGSDREILTVHYMKNGEINYITPDNSYMINQNGIIKTFTQRKDKKVTYYTYENDGKTIKEFSVYDGDSHIEKYYKNGELTYSSEYNSASDTKVVREYSHGIITNKYTNNQGSEKRENFVLYNMNNIFKIDNYGYKRINPDAVQYLIEVLDKDNIANFLFDYQNKYKKSFTEDLSSQGYDTKNKDKEKLLSHIEKILYKPMHYEPNKTVRNNRIKNNNYTSSNIYDVQYKDKKVIIYNKTTGKKSTLDFDELLGNIKIPEEKVLHMANFQKLPAEVLELYANEGIRLRGNSELIKYNKKENKKNIMSAEGIYKMLDEKIMLAINAHTSTYIHEIFHAADFDAWGDAETDKKQLIDAFNLGLKRYLKAGFTRYCNKLDTNSVVQEKEKLNEYYFSADEKECWSEIGVLLFYGKVDGQEILKECWPELIELEKKAIAKIQNKPSDDRFSHL